MATLKHTKGKWSFYPKYQGEHIVSIKSGNTVVADVMGETSEEVTKEEALSNAKLIAAAPDLLEALEQVKMLHLDNECNYPEGTIGFRLNKIIEAAIKKATS